MSRRWKVRKLGPDSWLFRHPDCPPRAHTCWRGLIRGTLCGVRYTLKDAYRAAVHRYATEATNEALVRGELAAMARPGAGYLTP